MAKSGICMEMIEFVLEVILSRGLKKQNRDIACTKKSDVSKPHIMAEKTVYLLTIMV